MNSLISANNKVRVMIVDDSAVVRGLFSRALQADGNIEVVASVSNGEMAIRSLQNNPTDIIVLDIEMPVMDGITALPKLLEVDPDVKVIIASTLTKHNAQVTLEALKKGASECLTKPSTTRDLASADDFKRDLLNKIKVLGQTVKEARTKAGKKEAPKATATPSERDIPRTTTPATSAPKTAPIVLTEKFKLKTDTRIFRPQALVIGSSTGGPQALFRVIEHLKDVQQPIFLTQHMPETFTAILAEHITKQTGVTCAEGVEGEVVVGGRIYLAPGGYHMTVVKEDGNKVIRLNKDEPENFCRPAVDPMLRSVMGVFGSSVLATILTGMGSDGQKSCKTLADNGGMVLAQDKKTSVVWGMPGAVAMANICFDVLPLDEVGPRIKKIATM